MRIRLSLRVRATLIGTTLFAALLALGSVVLVTALENRLTQATDQLLRSRVDDLLSLAAGGDLSATLSSVGDNGVAQVVAADGRVVAASPNISGAPALADLQATGTPETSTFQAPDDGEIETYRFWYAAGRSPQGHVTVFVGDSLESVSEATAALRRSLWIGVPVVVLLLSIVMWLLLGRALGRLDRIRVEVDHISETNLDSRVAGDGVDDEVGRLAATMNAMLERLDASARRQREFIADVSHDLQSPLAAQRVSLELAISRPDDVNHAAFHRDVLGATNEMERLVGDLLVVAALDAHPVAPRALFDLDSLVLDEASRARTSGASIDTSQVSGAPAYANADDVRRVVRNLLDNAVSHARTRVVLTVEVVHLVDDVNDGGGWAQLLVADDGPGVPSEVRDHVFERFYRAEPARSRRGSGLGLSIARGLAERNGGDVQLLEPDQGALMRVRLPMTDQPVR